MAGFRVEMDRHHRLLRCHARGGLSGLELSSFLDGEWVGDRLDVGFPLRDVEQLSHHVRVLVHDVRAPVHDVRPPGARDMERHFRHHA